MLIVGITGGVGAGKSSILQAVKEHCNCKIVLADDVGNLVKEPGQNTFDICSKYVDGIVTVTDDEVSSAILAMIEQHKLIAEGAGAVAVAAAMFNKVPIEGKNVVCVVSGGNIDVTILDRVIKRGLQTAGRISQLVIESPDRPGQLFQISRVIAENGGNIVAVHHDRSNTNTNITGCFMHIDMETRNFEHIKKIKEAITKAGFKIWE